jgi:prepilin-type N-terminal cleavage/methylation domain-containing protein
MRRRRYGTRGFTLLEVIVVLVLIGIVSVVVFSRFQNIQADLIGQTAAIKAHLRYAQARSMNSTSIWGIRFINNTYWLFNDGNIANRIVLPGAESDLIDLSTLGIGVTQGVSSSFTVAFDDLGRPSSEADGDPISGTDLILAVGKGSENLNLTVTANTGFIP